jgi:hypothetical protein
MKNLIGRPFPRSEDEFHQRMLQIHRRWESLHFTCLTYPFAERLLEQNRLWWELKRYYDEGRRRGYSNMVHARHAVVKVKEKKRWTIADARRQERARAPTALRLKGWQGDYASYKKACLRARDIVLRNIDTSR